MDGLVKWVLFFLRPRFRPAVRWMVIVMVSLPLFMAFQNFSADPQWSEPPSLRLTGDLELPVDLFLAKSGAASEQTRRFSREELSRRAWDLVALDEHQRALRLLAAQIAEFFPRGSLSTEDLRRSFLSQAFEAQTQGLQFVAGDPIPVCQWLKAAYTHFLTRRAPDRRCSRASGIDLSLEANQDCRYLGMIENCSTVPPLPYPSLFESWRICGLKNCDRQINEDLKDYLRFFRITEDPRWLFDRFIPMSTQVLDPGPGPFVQRALLDFAEMILAEPRWRTLTSATGVSLEEQAHSYLQVFDIQWSQSETEWSRRALQKESTRTPLLPQFIALLKWSRLLKDQGDPRWRGVADLVQLYAEDLQRELKKGPRLHDSQVFELTEFALELSRQNLVFTADDLLQIHRSYRERIQQGPWRTRPKYFGLYVLLHLEKTSLSE